MAPRRDFRGRVAVVTGAGSGIGAAIARRFAKAGAHVELLDLDGEAAAGVAAQIASRGGSCAAGRCDVTDEADVRRALGDVVARVGGVDVLVCNAGITQRSLFADTDVAVFRRVMDVNLFGSLHCAKAALASLVERRGIVIVTSSIAGIAPLYERSGYAASKHALHGLFASLRTELFGTGVDVMLVCPSFTRTGIGRAALDGSGKPASHEQSTVGKVATPESVADAVFDGATRSRRLLVLTPVGKVTALLSRLAPALYEKLMARQIRAEIARLGS